VGFDGIKMYRMVDGLVLFIFSRAMTDILFIYPCSLPPRTMPFLEEDILPLASDTISVSQKKKVC
jgi:hypothetical protein